MKLPKRSDIELQLALLSAISHCSDGTAVAEELRPIVEKALSLIVPDDQKEDWTNLISWALIDMREKKSWLQSPYHAPGTTGASPESQQWVKTNRPSVDPNQRIWQIAEIGIKVLNEGPSIDLKVPSEKSSKEDEAGHLMYAYYNAHINELPKQIKLQREFIIGLLMKGMSAEDAFSRALKNMG